MVTAAISAGPKCRPSVNRLDQIQREGRHPDIDLLKAAFQDFLEGDEELPILFGIGNIYEYPDGFVPIKSPFVMRLTGDRLAFRRHRAEAFFQLRQGIRERVIRNRQSAIK